MVVADVAHQAVAVAVYVFLFALLVFFSGVKVIGWKSMVRRRRPRQERPTRQPTDPHREQ